MPNPWDNDPVVEQGAGRKLPNGGILLDLPPSAEDQAKEERARADAARAEEGLNINLRSEGRQEENSTFNNEQGLRTEFTKLPVVAEFQTVARSYAGALKTADNGTGDQALITAYAKILDPASVVREGEAAAVAGADSAIGRKIAEIKKNFGIEGGGQLSPEQRAHIRTEIKNYVKQYEGAYDQARGQYGKLAQSYGFPADRITGPHILDPYRKDIDQYWDMRTGGGGEVALGLVSPEESAKYWGGEAYYNEAGQPVGEGYEGVLYNAAGEPDGMTGHVSYNPAEWKDGVYIGPQAPGSEGGIIADLKETVTGSERSTPEIESLPDWATMPEMNELSGKGMLTGLGTFTADPGEAARIIQSNYPDVRVRQDAKGNYILRSRDGKEYAIKPGFRWSDVPRAAGAVLEFTPAGRAEGLLGAGAAAAGTQAAIEGSQAAAGGTFDSDQVVAAGLAGTGGKLVEKGVGAGINKLRQLRGGSNAVTDALEEAAAPTAADAVSDVAAPGAEAPAAGMTAAAPPAPLAEAAQKEIGELARKAVGVGPGAKKAREKLALKAQVNPEAKAAAERLGIDLPLDILSDNAQVKTVTGLARSQIGSDAQTAWGETVARTMKQADEALEALNATDDLAQVGDDVMARLTQTNQSLERQGAALRDEVDAAINVRDRVDAQNLQAELGSIITDMGGLNEAKQAFSSEEKKLLAMLGEGEVAKQPTYARINDMRNQIGEALFKGKGPWADTSQANLARYYKALADDQLAYIESKGGPELADKMRQSNTLFSKMYDGRRAMQAVFGSKLEKDLAPLINRAVTAPQRGDSQALNKLLETVPEDMRGKVLLSGIMANSTRRSAGGGFSFDSFSKLYRGLRKNAPIYKQIADAIGPQGTQVLQDLYAVSRRMAEGESRIIRTGASNQPLLNAMNAETLLSRLLKGAAVQTASKATATGVGAVTGGPVGAMAGATLAESLESALGSAGKSRLEKLHTLLSSGDFRNLAEKLGSEGEEKALNRLANSKEWNNFAARVLGLRTPMDRKAWLKAALTTTAVQGADPREQMPDLPVRQPVQ